MLLRLTKPDAIAQEGQNKAQLNNGHAITRHLPGCR
jgi:hypothetical protein